MKTNVQLSKNLNLTSIQENNWKDGKLISVVCFFDFFGEEGEAFVVVDKLESDYPSYAMTEISSELSESFEDLLEDEETWKKIVIEIKKYVANWEKQYADDYAE